MKKALFCAATLFLVGCAHRQVVTSEPITKPATVSKEGRLKQIELLETPRFAGDDFYVLREEKITHATHEVSVKLINGPRLGTVHLTEQAYHELTDHQVVEVTYREVYKGRNSPPRFKILAIHK